MSEMEVTFGRTLRVWWAFTWRSLVLSILLGAVVGFLVGLVIGVAGPQLGIYDTTGAIRSVAQILGLVVGVLVSIWAMKESLSKRDFGGFRLVMVPLGPLCPMPEPPLKRPGE